MRLIAALCALTLVACTPQSALMASPQLRDGLEAYRRGDAVAFQAAMAKADAEASPPAQTGCSLSVARLRHAGFVAAELHVLDRHAAVSLSEDARFLYLVSVSAGHPPPDPADLPPKLDCPNHPREARAADGIDRDSVDVAVDSVINAWSEELHTRYSDEYPAHMREATKELKQNGYATRI